MNRRLVLLICIMTLLLSIIFLKGISKLGMMPEVASYEANLVDEAFNGMLFITVPIFSFILSTLLCSLLCFRAGASKEEGTKFYRSRGGILESMWILTSFVLTLGLAAFGTKEFFLIRGEQKADYDIQVNSTQWSWDFYYPKFNAYTTGLLLPKDKRVRLLLTSQDVVHSFWVPEFRVKQDALPGKLVKLLFTPTKTGEYLLLCAELCGRDHTIMTAPVYVVESNEFEQKVKEEVW